MAILRWLAPSNFLRLPLYISFFARTSKREKTEKDEQKKEHVDFVVVRDRPTVK